MPDGPATRRAFEYRHVVGFEETNLVGNVYYVNHVRWQGRCREMFLREHVPEVLPALAVDLALVTLRVSCEYLAEVNAFEEIVISMVLEQAVQNRLVLGFEYRRAEGDGTLVARGLQEIACMRREAGRLVPTPVPPPLRDALRHFSDLV